MTATAKAVMLAAKLYEARDSVKLIFAERYSAVIERHKDTVRKAMSLFDCGELEAVPRLVAEATRMGKEIAGTQQLMLLAAVVEIVEGE